ncbi:cytochrome c-type biogenesis protein [Trifolium pratense]|uniref:Cytochrome c-type biogenesis protein n=1 Tax=Trifolium pratense TaxID=57577 RepID=A0A2K3MYX8_TRIPR|nr:cytochrome c-type biogenesis protein [Trifolium pratense]
MASKDDAVKETLIVDARAKNDDAVKDTLIVDARARNISHNVRCTECGSQSIEDSQADIAIILRKVRGSYFLNHPHDIIL